MALDVSVVVPVWNAGPNLETSLPSLLRQTMAADRYELLLVDDGSTDGSSQRLDAVAAAHPDRVRVLHLEASGAPGRPRNIGVNAARGDYVHFVDADDALAPYALERLHALAVATEADVVLGKLVSDFRAVNPKVFRENLARSSLADFPFEDTLTPHKVFRRAFLLEHGIRSPEGRRDLEDQLLVIRAFVRARSVAVLADAPCYFYRRRRGGGRNLGDARLVPDRYFSSLADVLDAVDQLPPGPVRDRVQRRFYRTEVLGRLRGGAMLRYEDEYRTDIATRGRALAAERFGPGVHVGLEPAVRAQAHLLMSGDVPALLALAVEYEHVQLHAGATRAAWDGGRLLLDVDAAWEHRGAPLRLGDGPAGRYLPAAVAPGVPEQERRFRPDEPLEAELALVDRKTGTRWAVPGLHVTADAAGVRVVGRVVVDPATAAGGGPLPSGIWDVRVWSSVGGWARTARLGPALDGSFNRGGGSGPGAGTPPEAPEPPTLGALPDERVVVPYWTSPTPGLALDVGGWARSPAELLAPRVGLVADGRHVVLRLPLHLAGGPLRAELLLQPEAPTPGGLAVVAGALAATTPDAAELRVRVATLPPDGTWQLWLRLGELGGAPPARLPWRVTTDRRGRLTPAPVGPSTMPSDVRSYS